MDYQEITVWIVIKRFLIGWIIAGVMLVVVSCIRYREFIVTVFVNNTWAWISAILPTVITVFGVGLMIRAIFR